MTLTYMIIYDLIVGKLGYTLHALRWRRQWVAQSCHMGYETTRNV